MIVAVVLIGTVKSYSMPSSVLNQLDEMRPLIDRYDACACVSLVSGCGQSRTGLARFLDRAVGIEEIFHERFADFFRALRVSGRVLRLPNRGRHLAHDLRDMRVVRGADYLGFRGAIEVEPITEGFVVADE